MADIELNGPRLPYDEISVRRDEIAAEISREHGWDNLDEEEWEGSWGKQQSDKVWLELVALNDLAALETYRTSYLQEYFSE